MRMRASRLSPVGVAVLSMVIAGLFVVARWQVAADGDITRFVVAGADYVSPSTGLHVQPGHGYDGQFSYRLAVDPTDLQRRAHGVVIDSPLRLQRIAYPVLAYVVSLGRASWVPWALVLVNVLGLGLLGLLGGLLARSAGRAPAAGLLLPAYFGFCTTLGRDLTEIVAAALLLAGIVCWSRGQPVLSALAFSGAVLSREAALPVLLVLALAQVAWGEPSRRLRTAALAAVPVIAFVTWQAVCWAVAGEVPLLASRDKNLVLPLSDLVPAAAGWVRGAVDLDRADLISLGQLATLVVLVVAAGVALRSSRAAPGIKVAWALAVLLVASLSANVWKGPADFRTAAELYVLTAVVLLTSRRSLLVPGTVLALATVATALFRVTSV